MKKSFEVPTIEKMNFVLSDNTMCTSNNVNDAKVFSDYKTQNVIVESQVGNMTE